MTKTFYVYVMTNKWDTVLYTGITNDLIRRVWEHKQGLGEGFTRQYKLTKLVYFEILEEPYAAIAREKQIKAGSREKKIKLIVSVNPTWRDLYETYEIASLRSQ